MFLNRSKPSKIIWFIKVIYFLNRRSLNYQSYYTWAHIQTLTKFKQIFNSIKIQCKKKSLQLIHTDSTLSKTEEKQTKKNIFIYYRSQNPIFFCWNAIRSVEWDGKKWKNLDWFKLVTLKANQNLTRLITAVVVNFRKLKNRVDF